MKKVLLALVFTMVLGLQSFAQVAPESPCTWIGDNGRTVLFHIERGFTRDGQRYWVVMTDYYDWCSGTVVTVITETPVN